MNKLLIIGLVFVVGVMSWAVYDNSEKHAAQREYMDIHRTHFVQFDSMFSQDGIEQTVGVTIRGRISDERRSVIEQHVKSATATYSYTRNRDAVRNIEQNLKAKNIPVASISIWVNRVTISCDATGCYSKPTESGKLLGEQI